MINQTLLMLLLNVAKDPEKIDVSAPHLSPIAEQSSYAIAKLLMNCVHWLLSLGGLQDNKNLFLTIYAVLIFMIAYGIGWVLSKLIVRVMSALAKHRNNDLIDYLTASHFFSKISRVVPAFVFLVMLQFTMSSGSRLLLWLERISWIYIIFVLCVSFCLLADVIWHHVDTRENKKKLPLKGLVQLVKGILWIIAIIIVIAILIDKSPGSLLAGLGAFAAVLMLVFKDSILGVVAGVQLSENDSLHVGDWIKVDSAGANGTVTEVSLTSVKVENWDKTTTMLPPYSLISGSFTNYRSMQESGTRRICRSYFIDADTVSYIPAEDLDRYRVLPFLDEYITRMLAIKSGKPDPGKGLMPDGGIETNLGLFRAYVELYLANSKNISHSDTCFVTTLEQTTFGIPLQIYCFTNTSSWLPYEAIQATIFEHLAIMLPQFNLCTMEGPSGRDTILEGLLSNVDPDKVFGMPYPYYIGQPMAGPAVKGQPAEPLHPVDNNQQPPASSATDK